MHLSPLTIARLTCLFCILKGWCEQPCDSQSWSTVTTHGECSARHEADMVVLNERLYLIGGRGLRPVDEYNPATNQWRALAQPPFQMHHFQAVVVNQKIAIIGAFTGGYPHETPVPNIWFFDPAENRWEKGPEIPEARRRGSAGVVVDGEEVYIACGIVDGHWNGFVPWMDRWNSRTGEWTILPDAPRPRDHFQAGLIDGKIVNAGGRTSHAEIQKIFELVIPEVDAYDIAQNKWTTLSADLPTPRAGCMAVTHDDTLLIIGGEHRHGPAHNEVERFSFKDAQWHTCAPLQQGRHGGGAAWFDSTVYVASGNATRGGGNEIKSLERIAWQALLAK